MLLVGTLISSILFLFCWPRYLGHRRTELVNCVRVILMSLTFLFQILCYGLTFKQNYCTHQCKEVHHVPVCNKSQTLPTVTEQHLRLNSASFSHSCVARLWRSHMYPSGIICRLIWIYFLVLLYHTGEKEHSKTKLLILTFISSRR